MFTVMAVMIGATLSYCIGFARGYRHRESEVQVLYAEIDAATQRGGEMMDKIRELRRKH